MERVINMVRVMVQTLKAKLPPQTAALAMLTHMVEVVPVEITME